MNKILLISLIVIVVIVIAGFMVFKSPNVIQETSNLEEFELTGETKEFDIIAKNWNFEPETINVNQGDTVVMNIKSVDVSHGFSLSEFNVNERLNPGETVRIEFVADKKGTFSFFCNVYCGSGHSGMKGELIVS